MNRLILDSPRVTNIAISKTYLSNLMGSLDRVATMNLVVLLAKIIGAKAEAVLVFRVTYGILVGSWIVSSQDISLFLSVETDFEEAAYLSFLEDSTTGHLLIHVF